MKSFVMRKPLLVIVFMITFHVTFSQHIVQFKASKPYSVFNFMETALGLQGTSFTLKAFIDSKIPKTDTAFRNLLKSFSYLRLRYNYKRDEFPDNRHPYRSTYDLLIIAAVKSESLADFKTNTIGILPNIEHQQLFSILTAAENYYDPIIWQPEQAALIAKIEELKKFQEQADQLFSLFRNFYKSSWTNDIPFTVSIFPIPGTRGNTTATPHANTLCVGTLTGEKDMAISLSVVFHEMCHVLYDEQLSVFQHQLDAAFTGSSSPFRNQAYNFFDEALATALGNGWSYQYVTGKADTSSWYNNKYIDGFAHAIYPMASKYLAEKKSIDNEFIQLSIQAFAITFPKSLSDYSILLDNMYLYTDAEGDNRQQVKNLLGKYFRVSRFNFSSPILHEFSIESLKKSQATQFIVIDRDHEKTFARLKEIFPELNKYTEAQTGKSFIINFYDKEHRPIIIVYVDGMESLDKALRLMERNQYLDEQSPRLTVN